PGEDPARRGIRPGGRPLAPGDDLRAVVPRFHDDRPVARLAGSRRRPPGAVHGRRLARAVVAALALTRAGYTLRSTRSSDATRSSACRSGATSRPGGTTRRNRMVYIGVPD